MSTRILYDPVNPLQNLSAFFMNAGVTDSAVNAFGLALLTIMVGLTLIGAVSSFIYNIFQGKK